MKSEPKLLYLEGVRGLAALMVVIHHYLLAFYPSHASGDPVTAHLDWLELWYYGSPFIFITNGLFYVSVFFILSGYVLSRSYFLERNNEYLISASIRRFPRLYIPVAFALIIAYVLLRLNVNYNVEASVITQSKWLGALKGDPSFSYFLSELIYKSMLFGNNSYINVLWTISKELQGSFLVFLTLFLFLKTRYSLAAFITLFLLLCIAGKFEFTAFVLGILLNYSGNIKLGPARFKRLTIVLLILFGLLLGGFPHIYYLSTIGLNGTFYEFLNYPSIIRLGPILNILGAFSVIFAVQNSVTLQKVFTGKICSFLGSISFSLYLIHLIVLLTFSSFLFIRITAWMNYNLAFAITFVVSLLLIFGTSYLMFIYVDKNSIVVSKKIYKKYLSYRPMRGQAVEKF